MIRNSVICDTCGVERKVANHWFVAYEHDGELRIAPFLQSKTVRANLKHLCGQTCLHRLVDEFLVRIMGGRTPATGPDERLSQQSVSPPRGYDINPGEARLTDLRSPVLSYQAVSRSASVFNDDDLLDFESSARLLPSPPLDNSKLPHNLSSHASTQNGKRRHTANSKVANPSRIDTAPCLLPARSKASAKKVGKPRLPSHSAAVRPMKAVKTIGAHPKTIPGPVRAADSQPPARMVQLPHAKPSSPALPNSSPPLQTEKPNDFSKEPVATPLKTGVSAPPKQRSLSPLRSIAGAWERARLWESQAARQRQATGKKMANP